MEQQQQQLDQQQEPGREGTQPLPSELYAPASQRCPLCACLIAGDNAAFNRHVDECLSVSALRQEEQAEVQAYGRLGLSRSTSPQECPLCCAPTASVAGGSLVSLRGCGHALCEECLERWLRDRSARRQPLTCPFDGCAQPLEQAELYALLGAERLDQYSRLLLEQTSGVRCCPTAGCTNACWWQNEEQDGPPKFDCTACGRSCCLLCHVQPYHEGRSCEAHAALRAAEANRNPGGVSTSRKEEIATERMLRMERATRRCPGCGAYVTRAKGCDKMMCLCGYRFCFKCGAKDAKCHCTGREHGFWDNQKRSIEDSSGRRERDARREKRNR